MEGLLRGAGFELSASVVYKADAIELDGVHETWKTYSLEDLKTRVMFFIGNRPVTDRKN